MRLRFLYNAGFIVALNLLVKPFWIFAIDRRIQNQSGPELYGEYYGLVGFSLLLSALLDAGIANFNARKVAIEKTDGLQWLPYLLGFKLVLFVAYVAITLGLAQLSGIRGQAWQWLLLICINQGLNLFNTYLRSNLAGLQRFKLEGLLGITDKLLMSALALPLVWGRQIFSSQLITDFILVQTLSYAITFALLLIISGRLTTLALRFSLSRFAQVGRQTLPFAILGILMGLYTKLDAVLLIQLLPDGAYAAGIYAAGYRLLDAASMVPALISGILLPQFAALLSSKQLQPSFVRTVALLMGGLGSIGAMLTWVHAPAIIKLLYHHQNPVQVQVFRWLMLAFIPLSLNYVFGTLLTALGKLKLLIAIAGIFLTLNAIGNSWLIPSKAAAGAAWVTFFTQTGLFLVQGGVVWRHFRWPFDAGFLLRMAGFTALMWGSSMLIPWPSHWQAMILHTLLLVTLLLVFFGKPIINHIIASQKGRF
jgi:O-antigen/teichoic acid export membrane protein